MIVLDASAAVEWLLRTSLGLKVQQRIGTTPLHAPHIFDVEVTHAVRRLVLLKRIPISTGAQAIEHLTLLRLLRHPHLVLLKRMWDLRSSISAYDASYIALSEALASPLITCDSKLASAHGHFAAVELFTEN
jgi:predicted nucleic acid-binding protein